MREGWGRKVCWAAVLLLLCSASPALSDCAFGVNNPAAAGCVHYDLSALQNPKGYTTTDEDHPNVSYIYNVCGNLAASSLPSSCAALPASPAYQMYYGACYYLAQLNSSLVVSSVNLHHPAALRFLHLYWLPPVMYRVKCETVIVKKQVIAVLVLKIHVVLNVNLWVKEIERRHYNSTALTKWMCFFTTMDITYFGQIGHWRRKLVQFYNAQN